MRMIDILPEHVRDWIRSQKAAGLSASTIAGGRAESSWRRPAGVRGSTRARRTRRGPDHVLAGRW